MTERDLAALARAHDSEARCARYLEELRWPDGVRCTRCHADRIRRVAGRAQYDCLACRHRFSVRSGTALEGSRVPLWKWLLAAVLLLESEGRASARRVGRSLGLTYKTAWFLCHRIRNALAAAGAGQREPGRGDAAAVRAQSAEPRSARHRRAYQAERHWREGRRGQRHGLRDACLALLEGPRLSYGELAGEAPDRR